MTGLPMYPECKHIGRPIPVLNVNKEIFDTVAQDYRVLPLFEKVLYEHNYRKYYSLGTNEFLECRWQSYRRQLEGREFSPFHFIDIRDFHFYNCVTRLLPKESIYKKTDFRFKLKVGPGVDFRGQMPIPQDLLMKRGIQKPKTRAERNKMETKDGGKKGKFETKINRK